MQNPEFFEITCRFGTQDEKLFTSIVNQGIDAHLEAFTLSKFPQDTKAHRQIYNFHRSELPILLRRLEELGTEEAESWAFDIQEILKEEQAS